MKLSKVVKHLRKYCPSFSERIAVAIDFDFDRGQVRMAMPSAVVVPDSDDAQESLAQNVTIQEITDRFSVILVVASADPQRGDQTADQIHDLRAEVWRALIGWMPDKDYTPIEYVGGEVLAMNRNSTLYTLSFESSLTLGHANGLPDGEIPDTWQEYELSNLPGLEEFNVEVDVIDPIADPNLSKPGPDGRTEFNLKES